ncbi:hypothetical protein [Alcanivorax sp.]|uniref:hypothetical protein n=1 Tax=Alcanivorax sp. TaxID=1872427 RepID=UPI0025B82A81|nr:hypothetical protein [Alcanivorax sp.]
MPRDRHGDWEVEVALLYAQANGWRVEPGAGPAHGRLRRLENGKENGKESGDVAFSVMCIWQAPKSAHRHAMQIRRAVDQSMQGGGREGLWHGRV